MTPAILLALTISSLAPRTEPVLISPPPAPQATMIVLCAQADIHGKVIAARLMHSSGSADLDKSAETVVLGQPILDEATASQHPGLWLPMAIATGENPAPVDVPSCGSLSK